MTEVFCNPVLFFQGIPQQSGRQALSIQTENVFGRVMSSPIPFPRFLAAPSIVQQSTHHLQSVVGGTILSFRPAPY